MVLFFTPIPILIHNWHCVCFLYESIVNQFFIHKYTYIFYFLNKRPCPKTKFYLISWVQNYAFTLGEFRKYSGLITGVLQTLSVKITDLSKLPGSGQFGRIAGVRVQMGIELHSSLPHPQESDLLLTLRRLMSYIYGAPILDVSRSHTTTQHSR